MEEAYRQFFNTPVDFRIVEKRTPVVDKILRKRGLATVRSIKCEPQPWCEPKICFINVDRMLRENGGTMLTGWIFNEYRNRSMVGEAHAVWRAESGKTIDITPHRFQPDRLLFAPDPAVAAKRGYTAAPKVLLSDDPRMIAIEAFESIFDQLEEDRFVGFGLPMAFTDEEVTSSANRAGLPIEVANYLFKCRFDGRQQSTRS